jgi:hypothetical protein
MRSRARTFQRRTRRSSRDADYRLVPLPRFRREIVALLVAAKERPRLDSAKAFRLVVRWDSMVRLRHSEGKPPCNVADHILRYERDGAVCPCGAPLVTEASRDRDRTPGLCRRCVRHGRDPERHNHAPHQRKMWCPNTRCITAQPFWAEKGETRCGLCKGTLRPVVGNCKACERERRNARR